MSKTLKIIQPDTEHETTDFKRDGSNFYITENALEQTLGWSLKDRGLCKGSTCIPIGERSSLCRDSGIALDALADILKRPLATDTEVPCVYLGYEQERIDRKSLAGKAPDFELPDWKNETTYRLSDFEGNKIFLLVWASW